MADFLKVPLSISPDAPGVFARVSAPLAMQQVPALVCEMLVRRLPVGRFLRSHYTDSIAGTKEARTKAFLDLLQSALQQTAAMPGVTFTVPQAIAELRMKRGLWFIKVEIEVPQAGGGSVPAVTEVVLSTSVLGNRP